jgi:hypothetical protein
MICNLAFEYITFISNLVPAKAITAAIDHVVRMLLDVQQGV